MLEECLLAAHLVEVARLLLNLDFLRLLFLGVQYHLDLDDHLHFDYCCLLDHWVEGGLLVLLVEYSVRSTAMDTGLHWMLLQRVALVLEVVAVVVVEVHYTLSACRRWRFLFSIIRSNQITINASSSHQCLRRSRRRRRTCISNLIWTLDCPQWIKW